MTKTMTARSILQDSIDAIDNAQWVCNTLIDNRSAADKPMGCALGLVGINAGVAQCSEHPRVTGPGTETWWSMDYPDEAARYGTPWPAEATAAIQALADTAEFPEGAVVETDSVSRVISFNDGDFYFDYDEDKRAEKLTPEQARAWFVRASELV